MNFQFEMIDEGTSEAEQKAEQEGQDDEDSDNEGKSEGGWLSFFTSDANIGSREPSEESTPYFYNSNFKMVFLRNVFTSFRSEMISTSIMFWSI